MDTKKKDEDFILKKKKKLNVGKTKCIFLNKNMKSKAKFKERFACELFLLRQLLWKDRRRIRVINNIYNQTVESTMKW